MPNELDRSTFDWRSFISRSDWQHVSLGLERTKLLLHKLEDPHLELDFIHVAGTNGKGSTCAYIASILQKANMKVGLFTSPYIEHFEERIQIDRCDISSDDLERVMWEVAKASLEVEDELGEHPTEFEMVFACASRYFAENDCDIVVCEVGLGGRLDSTNVISPMLSVITKIGLDHTKVLGSSIEEIAREKAGIIKSGIPAVFYPEPQGAFDVIVECAKDLDSLAIPIDLASLKIGDIDDDLAVRVFEYRCRPYTTKLLGRYQPENAALAIEAATLLKEKFSITDEDIHQGIAEADWQGRFEILLRDPLVIVDGSHNPQGVKALISSLNEMALKVDPPNIHFIIGILGDKDHGEMISILLSEVDANRATFHLYEPHNERALDVHELQNHFKAGLDVYLYDDAKSASKGAIEKASPKDVIVAFGTLYSIAEIKYAMKDLSYSSGDSKP